MIYRTSAGYLCDSTRDTMDSAFRVGVWNTFSPSPGYPAYYYEIKPGVFVRCPDVEPSANPANFTRDQLICFISGAPQKMALRAYEAALSRRCFAQNTERDHRGSVKYMWPHDFYKDSKPTPLTVKRKLTLSGFKSQLTNTQSYETEYRFIDHSDLLAPHHMWYLAYLAGHWHHYLWSLLGLPLFLLSLVTNSANLNNEQNQLQCMCQRLGPWAIKLYKLCNSNWKAQTFYYWESRNEKEYAELIVTAFSKY